MGDAARHLLKSFEALSEADRLDTVTPHTTALRQSRFEIAASPNFLRPGAFDAQGIVTVPTVRLMNRLGVLTTEQLRAVEKGVCLWLGITIAA